MAVNNPASPANPTASLGLAAINGVSPRFMRADAAPALNVAISPTWTGNHTHTPGSGIALTVNAVAGVGTPAIQCNGALAINGNQGLGAAYGSLVALVSNDTGSATRMLFGDGTGWSFYFSKRTGSVTTDLVRIQDAGNVTVNAPTAGDSLTLFNAGGGGLAIRAQATVDGLVALIGRSGGTNNPSIRLSSTEASAFSQIDFSGSAGAVNGAISVNGTQAMVFANTRAVTINAPSSGPALNINPVAGGTAISIPAQTNAVLLADFGSLSSASNGVRFPLAFTIGSSNGSYPYTGYNWTPVSGSVTANYVVTDLASRIQYNLGGFAFQTAPTGAPGNPITFTTVMNIAQAGNVTINAPTAGVAFAAVGLGANAVIQATSGGGSGLSFSAVGPAATQLIALSVQQTGQAQWLVYQAASNDLLRFNTSGADRWLMTATGALQNGTLAANVSALALTGGTNSSNTFLAAMTSGTAAGFSSGLSLLAGTNASDTSLLVNNQANTGTGLKVNGFGMVAVSQQSIVAASAAISNVDTYIPTPISFIANALGAAMTFEIEAWGTCTSIVANTSTFTVRLGSAGTVADTSLGTLVCTAATTGTAVPFKVKFKVTIRTIGASGSVIMSAELINNGVTGISSAAVVVAVNAVTTAFATTGALKLGFSYRSLALTTSSTFQMATVRQVL